MALTSRAVVCEALFQPAAGRQDCRRHTAPVSIPFEPSISASVSEAAARRAGVVVDREPRRVEPGEERRVRRQRQRNRRECLDRRRRLPPRACSSTGVTKRPNAVGRKPVGPHRVERDHEEVSRRPSDAGVHAGAQRDTADQDSGASGHRLLSSKTMRGRVARRGIGQERWLSPRLITANVPRTIRPKSLRRCSLVSRALNDQRRWSGVSRSTMSRRRRAVAVVVVIERRRRRLNPIRPSSS